MDLRHDFFNISLLMHLVMMIFASSNVEAATGIEAIEYPVATAVVVGSTVEFTCVIVETATTNQILDWFIDWDDDALKRAPAQINNIISPFDRNEFFGHGTYETTYQLVNEPEGSKTHTCNLTIYQTTLKDNGHFGCTHQTNPSDSHRTLLKQKIRLDINPIPGEDPQCVQSDTGESSTLSCIASRSRPPADVTWYDQYSMPITETRSISQTVVVPKVSYRQVFTCHAEQPSLPPKTCMIVVEPSIIVQQTSTATTTKKTMLPIKSTTKPAPFITTSKIENLPTTLKVEPLEDLIASKASKPESSTEESATTSLKALITKVSQRDEKNEPYAIIGAVAGASLLIILVLLLMLLLLCRKKRRKQEPKKNRESQYGDNNNMPQTNGNISLPELPTLEPPPQPVTENPYGYLPGGSTRVSIEPEPDDDYPQKPWKNDPDMLRALENNGYISDADSATESEAAVDGQTYQDYYNSTRY